MIREQILKDNLIRFFKNEENFEKFYLFTQKSQKYSLRFLDWFISKYCREKNINFTKENNHVFFVYSEYKRKLKIHSKNLFDPFNRKNRFDINKPSDKFITISDSETQIGTSLGQLNFFHWIITENVFDYVEKNYDTLVSRMKIFRKTDFTRRKKRKDEQNNNNDYSELKEEKTQRNNNKAKNIANMFLTFN